MPKEALEGLKVADFSWVLAGPLVTKHLADYGATVVRIESQKRLDIMRATLPYKDARPGIDRSGYYAFYNSNKYDISLDLAHPKGKEVARRLVAWADVVVENFAPGTMESLGFGYDDLKKIKPGIIMLRLSNQGQTGPYSRYASLGNQLNALSGFVHFTGWPDRECISIPMAYSDYFCPWLAVSVLLAAIDYKKRTGEGQVIDISQFEASLQFIGPYLLEYTANGTRSQRNGNSHPYAAPHGAFRCQGDDRWCTIAVFDDKQWKSFCAAIDNPSWCSEPGFATATGRKQNEEKLNRLVETWTSSHSAEEAMQIMQRHGVPAGVVNNAEDVYNDPQLKSRGHVWLLDHREMGPVGHLGTPGKLSKTPATPKMPAPCLGEHTEFVCTSFLGMSDDEFTKLFSAGAFGKF
jgi:benzylsuccinate CoA-transferase BbsF subunit